MRAFKRPLRLVFVLALLAALAGWGLFLRERGLNDVQRENLRLREMISRLGTEFRVADVVVTAQQGPPGRRRTTTFRFVEYDRQGNALEPRNFTVAGDVAYFDALVLKFDDDYVGAADPLRGRSLHLFRRVFGEYQAPADGFLIDAGAPDGIPVAMRQGMGSFEEELWRDFWALASDADKAAKRGVRVAQGEAVYLQLQPGRTYRLTIEADGGLNIRPASSLAARN
ncbi:MAG: hypothetical protein HYY18_02630 [Planctomycetes bacterium]|nr:hypothetical protein [Planctomycetota bacterium]